MSHAQAYETHVTIDPPQPNVEDEIRLDIFIYGDYFPDLKITEPRSSALLLFIEGPFVRPIISQNGIVISYILKAKSAGRTTLGRFSIRIGSKTVATQPLGITISSRAERRIKDKPKGVWKMGKKSVHVGETVIVTLEVTIWDKLLVPVEITIQPPKHAWFEKYHAPTDVEKNTLEERVFYIFPVQSFLFTPTRVGYVTIPSVKIVFRNGESLFTESQRIRILPLPELIDDTGAIGNFILRSWVEREEVRNDEDIIVRIKLIGNGNLKFVRLPEPEMEDVETIGTSLFEQIDSTEKGYLGYKEAVWRFRTSEAGTYLCSIPAFYFLDPDTDRIREIEAHNIKVTVVGSLGEPALIEKKEEQFSLRTKQEILSNRRWLTYSNPYSYLLFLPGPVVLVLFLYFKSKRWVVITIIFVFFFGGSSATSDIELLLESANRQFAGQNYCGALESLLRAQSMLGENSALEYNIALCFELLEQPEYAIHFLRKALRNAHQDGLSKALLERIEKNMGLVNQIPPGAQIPPDYPFIALIVFLNIFFVVLAFYLMKRNIRILVPLVLIVITVGGAFGTFVYMLATSHQLSGILVNNSEVLRRIPEEIAQPWMSLSKGTAFRILKKTKKYIFIQSGIGLEGWISEEKVLLDRETIMFGKVSEELKCP